MDRKYITLKNLMIAQERCIGLKFYSDIVIQALVNDLPGVKWSEEFNMNYISNTSSNLDLLFKTFRGVAWVNCNHFFSRSAFGRELEPVDVQKIENREPVIG